MTLEIIKLADALDAIHSRMNQSRPPCADEIRAALRGADKVCAAAGNRGAALRKQIAAAWRQAVRWETAYSHWTDAPAVLDVVGGRPVALRQGGEEVNTQRTVARNMIAVLVAELGALAKRLASGDKAKRRKRQNGTPPTITPKQAEAVQIVGECRGNLSAAARQLGVDRKTVKQHYDAGLRNAGLSAAAMNQNPKSKIYPMIGVGNR